MRKRKKERVRARAQEAVDAYVNTGTQTDPFGYYTGITEETRNALVSQSDSQGKIYINPNTIPMERPIQDADDL